MTKTVDIVAKIKEIEAYTPKQIAKMSEEERFKARVYLRVKANRLCKDMNILADVSRRMAELDGIEGLLEALQ